MLSREEFEQLVVDAVATLPPEILDKMDNVAITVQDWPSRGQLQRSNVGPGSTLFGLYEGVPLTRRTTHYGMVPPDRITIFRGPLTTHRRSPEAIAEQVRKTVIHEIGHHFGMSEKQIQSLGY
ncbi:MAG: metallopeptidase family protein [Chloroflexota bacterium]|nr:metallopeptidase family protein [Chloroflexota bacterium]